MLLKLKDKSTIQKFNLSPNNSIIQFLLMPVIFLVGIYRKKPTALYIALSGGIRQWYDLVFIFISQLRRIPIFIHHHSFSYLNDKSLSNVLRLKMVRNAVHIALCECMANDLIKHYNIPKSKIRIISNISFLGDIERGSNQRIATPLSVGFISNITAEKGIFEFFSVLQSAADRGLSMQGIIAGPVDINIRNEFEKRLLTSKNIRHIGAVYGAEKSNFFSKIDVLFFPTKYLNEAEPVTILEAFGHGIPVISFERGCITSMIKVGTGYTIPHTNDFINSTLSKLQMFSENPKILETYKIAAYRNFEIEMEKNKINLNQLIDEITQAHTEIKK